MRTHSGFAVLSVLLGLSASAAAGDDPAARVDDLAKKLTAPDPAVRERAEKDVAAAPVEDLRALVRLLRDRMLAPAPDVERDPFVGAEIPKELVKDGDAAHGLYYRIELLALEPDVAAKWLGCPQGASGGVVVAVPAANAERLRGGRDGRPNRAVSTSEMAAHDGQTVFVQLVDRIAYLADYEVQLSGPSQIGIADPIVAHTSEGVHLGVRGRLTGAGIHLEIDARGAHVARPIPVVQLPLVGTATPVQIQVPTTTAFRARTATDVPDGGSFLLGDLGPAADDGRRLAALVTVHATDFTKPGVVPNPSR